MSNADTILKAAVLAELAWEPSVTAAHIGVAADDGVITLTGHVQRYAEKHAAELSARRVKGVRAIADEIEIELPGGVVYSDEDIAKAAIASLAWDATVPHDAVKVTVAKGWVTLTGEVGWHFEHDAIAQDVRRLRGVVGVTNEITIKAGVNTANISDDITHALHRSWFFDPDKIKVTADGGKITLTGYVDTWNDRALAGSTAWAAPGTTDVENHLIIS